MLLYLVGKRIESESGSEQCTRMLDLDLVDRIIVGETPIDIGSFTNLFVAYAEGRVVTLQKHKIEDGADAWTIVDGKVEKGTITHHKDPYRMYFLSKTTGFPCDNGNIGINLFVSEAAAIAAFERK